MCPGAPPLGIPFWEERHVTSLARSAADCVLLQFNVQSQFFGRDESMRVSATIRRDNAFTQPFTFTNPTGRR